MKKIVMLIIISLSFITCKKKIMEPKHKNTGRNIAYVEFDGHKYLFEKKSITFYKNIKGKFKSAIDNSSGLKPVFGLYGDRFNFQGVIMRIDGYRKKKSNNNNQIDLMDFNITGVKNTKTDKWICDSASTFTFQYVLSYNPWEYMGYEAYGYSSPPFASNINIDVLKIDKEKQIFSMVINANVYDDENFITKPIHIYFDIEIQ